MTHEEIRDGEVYERYALGRLAAADRRAFQEHYFECDECFARTQEAARFVAGVRHAARAGALSETWSPAPAAPPGFFGAWLRPAFAAAACATLALTVALGWLLLARLPALREEAARERRSREEAEVAYRRQLSAADEALAQERRQRESAEEGREAERSAREAERSAAAGRERLLAQNRTPAAAGARSTANTPLVILDAVRGAPGGGPQLALGGGATGATIWVEVAPDARFDSYRLQLFRAGRLVETVRGARPNSYGAVAVTVPARLLLPGSYVVRLFGVKGGSAELVGEYELGVRAAR